MSIITDFVEKIKNDPQAKRKFLAYGIAIAIFSVILIVLVVINSSSNAKNETPKLTQETGIELGEVPTAEELEKSNKLTRIGDAVFNQSKYQVSIKNDSKISYIDENGHFVFDGKVVSDNIEFSPVKFYEEDDTVFLNNYQNHRVYKINETEVSVYPEAIISIAPKHSGNSLEGYYYIEREASSYALKSAATENLDIFPTDLGNFNPTDNTFAWIHVFEINDKPYVIIPYAYQYEFNVDIIGFENGVGQLETTINDLSSLTIGQDQILYTVYDRDQETKHEYLINLLDFTTADLQSQRLIELHDELKSVDINGNIHANRCEFYGNDKILCLVKKDIGLSTNGDIQDILVQYNYKTKEVAYPYPNIIFSATDVYVSSVNEIYVLTQKENQLYKFVKE